MNQRNIGQNNVPSVKVHHNPGGKSNWSFGWTEEESKPVNKNQTNVKYHNESHFSMTENAEFINEEEKRREEERRKKEEEINNKLPTYDPKNGNKTSIVFGDDKPDYRRKDQVNNHPSIKVRNPPGGKSNIQFG